MNKKKNDSRAIYKYSRLIKADKEIRPLISTIVFNLYYEFKNIYN